MAHVIFNYSNICRATWLDRKDIKHIKVNDNFSAEVLLVNDAWLPVTATEMRSVIEAKRYGEGNIQTAYRELIEAVNAAIYLRRPLLVTGKPGSGKTSLAYAIAYELKLGNVLPWAITTRTKLEDGLYRYDAIARLQSLQLAKLKQDLKDEPIGERKIREENIGDYLQLGSLGTAFLPSYRPRVLLIDELDKSDLNLPNDLLNLFEEGGYPIPELERLETNTVKVRTADIGIKTQIEQGRVQCTQFPIVVMTSNGERDFPPAFLRRCLRVRMPAPNDIDFLHEVVNAHFEEELGAENWKDSKKIIIYTTPVSY